MPSNFIMSYISFFGGRWLLYDGEKEGGDLQPGLRERASDIPSTSSLVLPAIAIVGPLVDSTLKRPT